MTIASAHSTRTTTDQPATQPAARGLALEEHVERERHEMIAVHAYHLAMARGFTSGCELDDWLAAERALAESTGDQAG